MKIQGSCKALSIVCKFKFWFLTWFWILLLIFETWPVKRRVTQHKNVFCLMGENPFEFGLIDLSSLNSHSFEIYNRQSQIFGEPFLPFMLLHVILSAYNGLPIFRVLISSYPCRPTRNTKTSVKPSGIIADSLPWSPLESVNIPSGLPVPGGRYSLALEHGLLRQMWTCVLVPLFTSYGALSKLSNLSLSQFSHL